MFTAVLAARIVLAVAPKKRKKLKEKMFSLKTAWRFISFNKLQSFFIVLGIAIGVAVQIFVGILIDSLQQSLINQTVGSSPQIIISNEAKELYNLKDLSEKTKGIEGVKIVQGILDNNAILLKDSKNYPVLVRGLDITNDGIYKINNNIIEGKLPDDNEIIIGKDLIAKSGYKIGDEILLVRADGQKITLIISGIYDQKVSSINNVWLITNTKTSQKLFSNNKEASQLEVQVDDVFLAKEISDKINQSLRDSSLAITNWQDENKQLLSALSGQSTSSYMIQIFVLMSVVIAIASILAITVTQKSKQIGILKAMGLKDNNSLKIFVYQGSLLGFFGVAAGLIIGLGLFWSFNTFAKNPDGSSIVTAYYRWGYIFVTALIAFIASILAGFMPAIKSSKLNPIDIIRNN